nr:uncharacterized protein LOC131789148 [Pocillopora verrucosa]XP_058962203.1 uncharacterized protein LOC131789148 [Pocillopora verrucosa]
MDIEVDEDLLEDLGDQGERKERQVKLKQLKESISVPFYFTAELTGLLKTPLIPAGFSGKYPTKTGSLIMPGIKAETNLEDNEKVAVEDVRRKKRNKKSKT